MRWTDAYHADTGRADGHTFGISGIVFIGHDSSNNNFGNNIRVYNNTILNPAGTWCGVVIQSSGNVGNIVRNNLWFSNKPSDPDLPGGAAMRTNNSGLNVLSNNLFHRIYDEGRPSPDFTGSFVSISTGNVRLTAHTSPAGANLGSAYTPDMDGTVRSNWDIGAFEYKP